MPNPYDDIFGNEKRTNKPDANAENIDNISFGATDDIYPENEKEPLDAILDLINEFTVQAESFSQLLSKMRAIDHKESNSLLRHFLVTKDKHKKNSLAGEKRYHDLLTNKFEKILLPMRDLAHMHYKAVQKFNKDIDKHYYSFDKTDRRIKTEKSMAVDGINMQRRILSDAAESLNVLVGGMEGTERRIKNYINVGGINNISLSEYEIIVQKRSVLTRGQNHKFDFTFFDVNLIDKTAISLGIYMKETTSQYMGKLMHALDLG